MSGPLAGVRVIEIAAIGPAPFTGMLLADLGAEVIRIDRPRADPSYEAMHAVLNRGRRRMTLDLKSPHGVAAVRRLAETADILTEGFRPGVAERLGIGPAQLHAANPALVYGRMTGWGQDGPRATAAGHDINYIALSGALAPAVGSDGAPTAPLNMLGDFGGGGMLLAVGLLAALHHARATGEGQVIDAAIVDGAALLTGMHQAMLAVGAWPNPPGHNLFDGGAPYYGVFRTADDRFLSVGAIEPQFYRLLLTGLDLADIDPATQNDQATWPVVRARVAGRIAERTLAHWTAVFEGTDACVAPVLEPEQALTDAHLGARSTYLMVDGVQHPAPAPRFSLTETRLPPVGAVDETQQILAEVGLSTPSEEAP